MGIGTPTTGRQIAVLTFLLAVLVTCAPVWATTWDNVTVVTVDGWEYPGMTVSGAMGQDTLVMVGEGGGRRKLPRARIRLILDADGRDITQAVLTAPGDGTTEPAVLEPESGPVAPAPDSGSAATIGVPTSPTMAATPRPLRNLGPRCRFKVSPSLGLGYSQASGDWFTGMTSGMAIDGKVRIMFSDTGFMVLSYRHQGLGVDSSMRELYGLLLDWDVSFSEYFVGVGNAMLPKSLTAPFAYGEVGLGIIVHNLSATIVGNPYDSDPQYNGTSLSTNESKLGFSLEGGVIVPISAEVAIDLSVNGRMTSSGGNAQQETFGFLLGGRVGVAILMGNE
ncbi:MAG: hypothetical protein IPK64_17075 [bacterium]|nr:hypothetical protein [bacterium]